MNASKQTEKVAEGKPRGRLWILAVVIVIGLGIGGFFLFGRDRPQEPAKAKITLGCERSLLTTPVWIAENKRYFQEAGLNVTIKEFDSGKASLVALLKEKNVDVCTVAQTPIMFNSFDRDDFVIIAAMVSSDKDVKVLVRQDKGIKAPSDLKGKKVGLTKGTTGQFFLDLFLTHKGIAPSEIESVDLGPSALPQALSDGRVDAICTWEPHIVNAKRLLGQKALVLPSEGIYREDFYFVASRKFAKNNPEALKRFLRAVEKGEEFIRGKREKAISIVSERLKSDRALTSSIWGQFTFQLVLDQSILTSLEDEARWAIKEKLTKEKEVPNYLNLIHVDALKAVKPEAVTIVR